MATKYTQWPFNRPNRHKICKHLSFQDPPKFTQNWDFWLENMPSGSPDSSPESSKTPFFCNRKLKRQRKDLLPAWLAHVVAVLTRGLNASKNRDH
jgi:hypothetical protein